MSKPASHWTTFFLSTAPLPLVAIILLRTASTTFIWSKIVQYVVKRWPRVQSTARQRPSLLALMHYTHFPTWKLILNSVSLTAIELGLYWYSCRHLLQPSSSSAASDEEGSKGYTVPSSFFHLPSLVHAFFLRSVCWSAKVYPPFLPYPPFPVFPCGRDLMRAVLSSQFTRPQTSADVLYLSLRRLVPSGFRTAYLSIRGENPDYFVCDLIQIAVDLSVYAAAQRITYPVADFLYKLIFRTRPQGHSMVAQVCVYVPFLLLAGSFGRQIERRIRDAVRRFFVHRKFPPRPQLERFQDAVRTLEPLRAIGHLNSLRQLCDNTIDQVSDHGFRLTAMHMLRQVDIFEEGLRSDVCHEWLLSHFISSDAMKECGPTIEGPAESIQEDSHCTICLGSSPYTTWIVLTRCSHRFHPQCIIPWLARNSMCPTCRAPVTRTRGSSSPPLPLNADPPPPRPRNPTPTSSTTPLYLQSPTFEQDADTADGTDRDIETNEEDRSSVAQHDEDGDDDFNVDDQQLEEDSESSSIGEALNELDQLGQSGPDQLDTIAIFRYWADHYPNLPYIVAETMHWSQVRSFCLSRNMYDEETMQYLDEDYTHLTLDWWDVLAAPFLYLLGAYPSLLFST